MSHIGHTHPCSVMTEGEWQWPPKRLPLRPSTLCHHSWLCSSLKLDTTLAILIILKRCFIIIYVYVCGPVWFYVWMHVGALRGQKRALDSTLQSQVVWAAQHGCWDSNHRLQREQEVLLTTEPALWSLVCLFWSVWFYGIHYTYSVVQWSLLFLKAFSSLQNKPSINHYTITLHPLPVPMVILIYNLSHEFTCFRNLLRTFWWFLSSIVNSPLVNIWGTHFVHACVCVHEEAWTLVCEGGRGQSLTSSQQCHPPPLKQGFSLAWSLPNKLHWISEPRDPPAWVSPALEW